MDTSKDIEPITTLKREASELIERARDRQTPIVITQNGKPTAVLQSVEAYERQRQALLMLKLVARGLKDVDEGRTLSHTEIRRRARQRLAALKRAE